MVKPLVILMVLVTLAIALTYAEEKCKVGDTKQEGCNSCKCIQGGWACTRKVCPKLDKRQTRCKPGETFQQDCNTCTCSPDGRNARCTLKACG